MAFKGIDFSRMMNETPEEREARRVEAEDRRIREDQEAMQADVNSRAGRSTQRMSITVEDVEFLPEYGKRTGVYIRGTNPQNEPVSVLFSPLEREDYGNFTNRFHDLQNGQTIVADGLFDQRRWKDSAGAWQSKAEFHALMPVSPLSLTIADRVSKDVNLPLSSFAIRQKAAAAHSQSLIR